MSKYISFILFFIFSNFYSQLAMSIEVLEKNEKIISFKINIINDSSQNYVLPIDTAGFKTYMSGNACSEFLFIRNFPDLGFVPMIRYKNSYIESISGHTEVSPNYLKPFLESEKQYKMKQGKVLKNWKKSFHLYNKNENWVRTNEYLYNHLQIIKSKEMISFIKTIDIDKINYKNDLYLYNFYPLEKNTKYNFFIKICIDRSIFNFLTEEQKEKFKNSTFFDGELKSNEIEFLY